MASSAYIDDKVWRKLRKQLEKVGDLEVRIGILGSEGGNSKKGDLSLVEIATVHEFGSPAANIPERSFLRSTLDREQRRITQMSARLAKAIVQHGVTVERALGVLGAFVQSKVKARIRSNIPPKLAPATIARKGSSVALIDTGQLINSIQWKVFRAS